MRAAELIERVYRGCYGGHDPAKVGHITWYTTSQWLAKRYACGFEEYVLVKDISDDTVNKSFHHGLGENSTEITAEGFGEQVKKGVIDAHNKGWIDKETAMGLVDEIEQAATPAAGHANQRKPFYKWWQEDSRFTNILKKAGYKAIYNLEGDFDTYGIIT